VKTVTLTDADVPEILRKFFECLSIRLDGQMIDLRLSDGSENLIMFALFKSSMQDVIKKHDPSKNNNIKLLEVNDPAKPGDFVVRVDFSGFQGSGGGFGGLIQLQPNLGDIHFHDWCSKKVTDIRWINGGLRARMEFENKVYPDHAITYNPSPGKNIDANVKNFRIDIFLVPYVFWDLTIPWPNYSDSNSYDKVAGLPRLTAKELYTRYCDLFIYFSYDFVNIFGLVGDIVPENTLNTELGKRFEDLSKQIESNVDPSTLYMGFAMLFFGLGSGSCMGTDIQANKARFLFFDENECASSFTGDGKIVAVRKEQLQSHLYPQSFGQLEGKPYKYKPDNIAEVEIQDTSGKHFRIATLNLIESIQEGKVHIQGVHPVFRHKEWGDVQSYLVRSASALLMDRKLAYNGYLRSNPNVKKNDNLDNLPTFDYDQKDPLFRNLYDGTAFFVKAGYYPDFRRFLYHRAWKLPHHGDHVIELLNGYLGYGTTGVVKFP